MKKEPSKLIKKGWCKRVFALDKDGKAVSYYSETATSWCLRGAIYACFGEGSATAGRIETLIAHKLGMEKFPLGDLGTWNNRQTSAEPVIKILEEVEQELGLK